MVCYLVRAQLFQWLGRFGRYTEVEDALTRQWAV